VFIWEDEFKRECKDEFVWMNMCFFKWIVNLEDKVSKFGDELCES